MIKINLLPVTIKEKKVGRIPLILILAAIIAIIVILPFYIYSKMKVSQLTARKTKLEQDIKELEPKVKEIAALIEQLQRKEKAIDDLAGMQRFYWSKKLNELSDLIPQNVKVEHLYLSSDESGNRILNIDGVTACRTGEERVKLIGDFITALQDKKRSSFYYKEDDSPNFGDIEFISAQSDKKDGYLLASFVIKMKII
ncbi:MAG: PilN domain-containing protein [bacterium]